MNITTLCLLQTIFYFFYFFYKLNIFFLSQRLSNLDSLYTFQRGFTVYSAFTLKRVSSVLQLNWSGKQFEVSLLALTGTYKRKYMNILNSCESFAAKPTSYM